MSSHPRVLVLVLLLAWASATARAEVLVRWDLDQVPPRESLGIVSLVIPASKPAAVQEALAKGYHVYLDAGASSATDLALRTESVSGVVVKGTASPQQLDQWRRRLRSPGARVLSLDDRGLWPHVRMNSVTLRRDVLQAANRSAQPWLDSNAVFVRIAAAQGDRAPLLLSYTWEPVTVADASAGPALQNYLVAIAEAGSVGYDLVLPLHEGFQRSLLLGQPAARADWQEIRRYIEFASWDLPRRYRRVANIGVVCADPMGSVEILRLLSRHNLPFEIVGTDALQGEQLKKFALVVALDPLKPAQVGPLAAFAKNGGTLVLNGPAQGIQWEGAVQLAKTERHASYGVGEGRVLEWIDPVADPDEFALDMREALGPDRRVVDVWNGITVLVAPYEDPAGNTVLVTAVNYAHDPVPIQVRVKGTFSYGYYESPESAPALLPLRHRNGFTEVVLPDLRVGARVFLSNGHEPR